jgi:formate hydrogenlyase subunit 6/NADH:ubiquinone oxidoreductase subunit I
VGAIVLNDRLPSINQMQCVGCAGCVAVCPTEALGLDDFDPTNFFFEFMDEPHSLLSCQKNIPCIVALSAEHLISWVKLKGSVVCDIGHCGECEIGQRVLTSFEPLVEDVNYLLEATSCDDRVVLEKMSFESQKEQSDRRDFFKSFHLKGIGKIKGDFEKEIQKSTDEFVQRTLLGLNTATLKNKTITQRRKLFFTALKRSPLPDIYHVVDGTKISFTSQKLMDDTLCTACQMCYRVCPTAALTSDMRNSKIDFDPFLCIKCHLCHDVCEPNAITLSPSYNLKEWYTPTVQNLVTYQVRRCNECDTLFSSIAGEKVCRRCMLEEEEAMELWGLK